MTSLLYHCGTVPNSVTVLDMHTLSTEVPVAVNNGRHWAELYKQGLLEVDRSKLPQLIEQAEAAIRERLLLLSQVVGNDEERQSLLDASRNLEVLRRFYCKQPSDS
jgi:hypothetical protein